MGRPTGGVILNARELLAVKLGLHQFQSSLQGRTVAVFCATTTAVAYLRKEGGTRSPLLNTTHLAQGILRWTGSLSIHLAPQFLPGSNNVLADALSRPHQLPHSGWSLNLTVFHSLRSLVGPNSFICQLRRSSLFDLLLAIPGSDVSRHGRVSPVLGRSSGLRVPSGGHPSACSRVAPGLHGDGAHPSGSTLGPAPLVLRPAPSFAGSSSVPPAHQGLLRLPRSRHLSPDLSRLRLHAWRLSSDFPEPLATEQSSLARRPSSRAVYQVRWSIYREWYHNNGHSVSRPTLAKVADFLYCLRYTRGLSVPSLSGYRSVLSAVFRFHLPSLSSDPVIRDLLRSFRLSSAELVLRSPAWDLSTVLTYFVSPAFVPLSQASFRALTLKTLFLLALATAKRVGELQALSSIVTFVAGDACLSYIPQFVTKSESLTRSFPRSFLVTFLADFAAGLNTDLKLCPVRALRLYLLRARSLSPGRHRLFVSPRHPSRAMSKDAVSFFLGEVISAAEAARPQVGSLRAYNVRSVSTSVAFHRNWSVISVLNQPLGLQFGVLIFFSSLYPTRI